MLYFIQKNNISLIVDLTHPYARLVSENAKKAAEKMNIEYIRYTRKTTDKLEGVYLNSYEEAYEYLKGIRGTVFFTTGSKI